MKVFLGGTCPQDENDFDYRTILIPLLEENDIDYFNPVVKDWTPECIQKEEYQKMTCNTHLYIIAPNMKGVYSIAEMFASLIQNKRSIYVYMESIPDKGFDEKQLKSLEATGNLFAECFGEAWGIDNEKDIDGEFVKEILLNE